MNSIIPFTEISDTNSNEKKVRSGKFGVNKRTGKRFMRATYDDGSSKIYDESRSGIKSLTNLNIPVHTTKDERDRFVIELLEDGYTQEEVAEIMDLSQGTISNIKRKYRK